MQEFSATRSQPIRILDAALFFLVLICVLLLCGWMIKSHQRTQEEHHLNLTNVEAIAQVTKLKFNIELAISAAKIMGAYVELGNGSVQDFAFKAKILLDSVPGISNIQLAPDAIVQHIYPLAGNEKAIGHNLILHDQRRDQAIKSIELNELSLAGPFSLIQGGFALVARYPIFLPKDTPSFSRENTKDFFFSVQNDKVFWGFSSVLIMFDQVLTMSDLGSLEDKGFSYRLWHRRSVDSFVEVLSGEAILPESRTVSQVIKLPNSEWYLDIAANTHPTTISVLITLWVVSVIVAVLMGMVVVMLYHRPREIRQLSHLYQQLLAHSKEEIRLLGLVFETRDALAIFNSDIEIVRINKAFTHLFGLSAERSLGAKPNIYGDSILLYPETDAWNNLQKYDYWEGECNLTHKYGVSFPARINVTIVRGDDGKIVNYVCRYIDITESKKVEKALHQATFEAQEANRVKAEFLALMSHEIRTPLNGVIGILNLLNDTELNGRQREYTATAMHSGQVLLDLINNILDFSKMESRHLELEESTVSMDALISSVSMLCRPKTTIKKLDFRVVCDERCPKFFIGDIGRLRQILLNLTNNAVKFTDHGRIDIRISTKPSHEQMLLRFSVRDTGIGISEKEQRRLFNRFNTIDSSYSRRYGGTGLGLSICRELVELMNGSIGVISKPGIGSEFWFEIPTQEADPVDILRTSDNNQTLPDLPPLNILVVEDVIANRLVIREVLHQLGHRVQMASNGIEAVEALRYRNFDIILMDLSMPEMDGLEATRSIRALPSPASQSVIIAMTAHAFSSQKAQCFEAGMNDYLTKPIDVNLLVRTMARWVAPIGNQSIASSVFASRHRYRVRVIANEKAPEQLELSSEDASVDTDDPIQEPAPLPFDHRVLLRMFDEIGNEFLHEFIGIFIDDFKERLAKIESAQQQQDWDSIKLQAHSLASSSATYGLLEFSAAARSLEHACASNDATAKDLVVNLLTMGPEHIELLSEWLAHQPKS